MPTDIVLPNFVSACEHLMAAIDDLDHSAQAFTGRHGQQAQVWAEHLRQDLKTLRLLSEADRDR